MQILHVGENRRELIRIRAARMILIVYKQRKIKHTADGNGKHEGQKESQILTTDEIFDGQIARPEGPSYRTAVRPRGLAAALRRRPWLGLHHRSRHGRGSC